MARDPFRRAFQAILRACDLGEDSLGLEAKSQQQIDRHRIGAVNRGNALIGAGSRCQVCGAVAKSTQEEVDHMNSRHPEVVAERMRSADFFQREPGGEWIDGLSSD